MDRMSGWQDIQVLSTSNFVSYPHCTWQTQNFTIIQKVGGEKKLVIIFEIYLDANSISQRVLVKPFEAISYGKMKKILHAHTGRDDTEKSQDLVTERISCDVVVEGACQMCSGKLMLALERLEKQGVLKADMQILAGSKASLEKCNGRITIAIGGCVPQNIISDCSIRACPPSEGRIYQTLLRFLRH